LTSIPQAIPKRTVKICSSKNGLIGKCTIAKKRKGKYIKGWGTDRRPKKTVDYIAQVTVNGKTYRSEPVSLTITPKDEN
jgi:hypothetical protein